MKAKGLVLIAAGAIVGLYLGSAHAQMYLPPSHVIQPPPQPYAVPPSPMLNVQDQNAALIAHMQQQQALQQQQLQQQQLLEQLRLMNQRQQKQYGY